MCNKADHYFMKLALDEASSALVAGDFPIGAALTVNSKLWGTARNALFSEGRTDAHAEHILVTQYSLQLRQHVRERSEAEICLYTTLEPCLMCLGIAVMHRVTRIVIACPDPVGGSTTLDPRQIGSIYRKWWPTIATGLYKETSCDLIIEFLKTEKLTTWKEMLDAFQQMQGEWREETIPL